MNQQERDEYLAIEWTGPGWKQLILDCDREMSAIDPEYTIDQIKEKYGWLRYYIHSNSASYEDLWKITNRYERLSMETCESCASTTDVTTAAGPFNSWIKTLCKACREKGNTDE